MTQRMAQEVRNRQEQEKFRQQIIDNLNRDNPEPRTELSVGGKLITVLFLAAIVTFVSIIVWNLRHDPAMQGNLQDTLDIWHSMFWGR